MKRVKTSLRVAAAVAAAPAAFVMGAGQALAADGVLVTNQETVQAHLDASGHVRDARVYEQLALQGHGRARISDPVSTKGLRNLDGFGGLDVKGGNLVADLSVDGERRLRTVSDFTKSLPLKVSAAYTFNGKRVQPGDVVGGSGTLAVHYVVENVTGRDQDVSFDDGTGTKVTRTAQVVIPMVGSLTTVLPPTFTDVRSGEAAIAGDGRGGTQLTFTMTLFGPIGSPRAEFGYAAKVTDGVVPAATVSALPVSPLDSPSFKGGAASYKGGADTGLQLTSGATEIDANVLKLRDGAAQLLGGLIKLRDGAQSLNAGLTGQAAPGAAKLAAGAGKASSGAHDLALGLKDAHAGAGQISAGLGQAQAGAARLSNGVTRLADGNLALREGFTSSTGKPDLVGGSAQVADGLKQISGGLAQLADAKAGLPQGLAGLQTLAFGLDHAPKAAGPADPGGLLQGVQAIGSGLGQVSGGLGGLADQKTGLPAAKAGVDQVKAGVDLALSPAKVPALQGGVDAIKAGLDAALAGGGDIDKLAATITSVKNTAGCAADPVCAGTAAALLGPAGIGHLRESTQAASGGLGQVADGLTELKAQLAAAQDGLSQVSAGLGVAIGGVGQLRAGVGQLEAGNTAMQSAVSSQLIPGVNALVAGVDDAVAGVLQLNTGAAQASTGATTLAGKIVEAGNGAARLATGSAQARTGASDLRGGLGRLAGGSSALTKGLGDAVHGSDQLADGNGQLADGAKQLSSGLGDAASGSGRLADGLVEAAGKAPALRDGAGQLSAQGTTKLVDSGKATAADYGLKYALIAAGAQRAKAEGMAYGAPANAAGATAYSLELAGMTGEGNRNVGRGLGALAVFGLGAGLTVLRRRWL